ncbi:type VI secretion system protein VasJ [Franzmannia pantelleriensis]|uniref:Type VI secretion system protein VasJ n=1 Tax=Franzmannia pantelleriensis TaxID=48727 RepID=A0A1G9WWI6_9GAMM|nr:type VI secretion system protein TssA [Halomonas pantelleriensis]SDM88974.1 type VI secretion system protein VasJ [Halomonas pantelleriensis]
MRITSDTQLAALLAPLGESRIGAEVEESADYLWLDEEMMKVGSLQHGEVDWEGAETRGVRLLSQAGKDLRVLGHLLHCLQRDGDAVRFALSLRLLAGSLEQWWEEAYPYAGPRGAKRRPRLFQQFVQRAVKLAAALDFGSAEDEHQACQQALEGLREAANAHQLPDDALAELARQLHDLRPTREAPPPAAANKGSESSAQGASASSASSATKLPELRLEAGNERANRQVLLKLADFLNEQSPGEALGYRLRRHAIWSSIQALPASREGGRTELAPVSADRIADYREALARGGDGELWRRIENSLAVSPYWLEGHRLSAQLAERLGHTRCAAAIRDEAARFLERLPGIEALSFNDASPFVDDETLRWLHSAPGAAGEARGGGDAEPWQVALDAAREMLDSDGLAPALGMLDQGLAAARSPRDSAYWRLASADLLAAAGLESLAQQHYQALHDAVAELELEQWEPALVARLRASLKG